MPSQARSSFLCTLDFSENERVLYVNMQKALKKYKRDFALEGNAELCEQKLNETKTGLELFGRGDVQAAIYTLSAERFSTELLF